MCEATLGKPSRESGEKKIKNSTALFEHLNTTVRSPARSPDLCWHRGGQTSETGASLLCVEHTGGPRVEKRCLDCANSEILSVLEISAVPAHCQHSYSRRYFDRFLFLALSALWPLGRVNSSKCATDSVPLVPLLGPSPWSLSSVPLLGSVHNDSEVFHSVNKHECHYHWLAKRK